MPTFRISDKQQESADKNVILKKLELHVRKVLEIRNRILVRYRSAIEGPVITTWMLFIFFLETTGREECQLFNDVSVNPNMNHGFEFLLHNQ